MSADLVALAAGLERDGARAVCLLDGAGAGTGVGGDDGGLGRYSFLGCEPDAVVVVEDVEVAGAAGVAAALARLDGLLAEADAEVAEQAAADGGPWPLAMGFVGYELGRAFERLPAVRRTHATPDLAVYRLPAVLRVDHATGTQRVLARSPAAGAALEARLAAAGPAGQGLAAPEVGALSWGVTEAAYAAAVERVLEYLRAGDAYQVNYTTRLEAEVGPGALPELYRALRAAAPPLGAYLALDGGGAILSTSPELFLRVSPRDAAGLRRVETRPIKGTRARGPSAAADAAEAAALRADPKERAEHLMIVDLERNDLGRVCEVGSVHVEDYGRVVTLPTLHHVVSTVAGTLRPEVGPAALLAATFPCGSITGAPKVRAMQLIAELEAQTRGVYTGAIGYFGARGALELSVAIRTAVVDRAAGRLSFGVGGGIVVDSTPAHEWAECRLKAAGLARALGPPGAPP
ncbi:MAG: anthranilate synthase component I family protein [Deltaproteobacteria bacterium]|nr:anthranilate synthase component I family protein [Deltaproteobacteria bacterium]